MHHNALEFGLLCHYSTEKVLVFNQVNNTTLLKASPCWFSPGLPFFSHNSLFSDFLFPC